MAEFLEDPPTVRDSLGHSDERSILTAAAFLMLAGIWHIPRLREQALPPEDDLGPPGFLEWPGGGSVERGAFDLHEFAAGIGDAEAVARDRSAYYRFLGEFIMAALRSGEPAASARAVAFGLGSPDPIVRVAALSAAVDLFGFRSLNFWERVSWFFSRDLEETVLGILGVVVSRMTGLSLTGGPPTPVAAVPSTRPPGLMLIHGTVLPTLGPPVWSVPGSGPLFQHIQGFRPDIYGGADHFRWEGGYTDYAREVACQNLHDWLALRQLNAIDAVAHSHGCNVLMASTRRGAAYGKVVLLSCPVHWHKYSPSPKSYGAIQSVRIRLDFVILADRGGQRFPRGTVPEIVLPFWYVRHEAPTKPSVWKKQNLDRLLR